MTFAKGVKCVGEWKDDIFISKSKPHLTSNIPMYPDVCSRSMIHAICFFLPLKASKFSL
jgi:hypothetical protein